LLENSRTTFRQEHKFPLMHVWILLYIIRNGFKLSIGDFKSVMRSSPKVLLCRPIQSNQIPPLLRFLIWQWFYSLVLQSSQCFRCVNSKDTDFVWHE
jgi:hypothetical protein